VRTLPRAALPVGPLLGLFAAISALVEEAFARSPPHCCPVDSGRRLRALGPGVSGRAGVDHLRAGARLAGLVAEPGPVHFAASVGADYYFGSTFASPAPTPGVLCCR
jgi:hypothetical protein